MVKALKVESSFAILKEPWPTKKKKKKQKERRRGGWGPQLQNINTLITPTHSSEQILLEIESALKLNLKESEQRQLCIRESLITSTGPAPPTQSPSQLPAIAPGKPSPCLLKRNLKKKSFSPPPRGFRLQISPSAAEQNERERDGKRGV